MGGLAGESVRELVERIGGENWWGELVGELTPLSPGSDQKAI